MLNEKVNDNYVPFLERTNELVEERSVHQFSPEGEI